MNEEELRKKLLIEGLKIYIGQGDDSSVYDQEEFVLKIPSNNNKSFDNDVLKAYNLGISKLGGLTPKTQIIKDVDLRINNKNENYAQLICQEKVYPIEYFLIDPEVNLDVVVDLIDLDKKTLNRKIIIPDPNLNNYGVSNDGNIQIIDFGSLIDDKFKVQSYRDKYFKPDENVSYDQLLNKIGVCLYNRLDQLEKINSDLKNLYIEESKLDFDPDFSLRNMRFKLIKKDFDDYHDKIKLTLIENRLLEKKYKDFPLNLFSFYNNIKQNFEVASYFENTIISYKYNDEFSRVAENFLNHYNSNNNGKPVEKLFE